MAKCKALAGSAMKGLAAAAVTEQYDISHECAIVTL